MVKPAAWKPLKSSTAAHHRLGSHSHSILCDDIVSCISVLDEVIAEFDDPLTYSSSSTESGTGSDASLQKLQLGLGNTQRTQHQFSREKKNQQINSNFISSACFSGSIPCNTETLMQQDASKYVKQLQVDGSQFQNPSLQKRLSMEQHPYSTAAAPIKPVRQGKDGYRTASTPASTTTHGFHCQQTRNDTPIQTQIMYDNNISKSVNHSSSQVVFSNNNKKPIPVTFVMKQGDLEKFLEKNKEENWNCRIEKNLPRSLRKTRKTCFVEDDEDDNNCRSPKDFRKNMVLGNNSPNRSPLLNQRRSSTPEAFYSRVVPAQLMRYEDASATCLQGTEPPPPSVCVNDTSLNNCRRTSTNVNLNELFNRNGRETFQAPSHFQTCQPQGAPNQILDIDDGYLSMINRHDVPILWPEGVIETETFTAEELKRLSVYNSNYPKSGATISKEQDYFSDDSLEMQVELESPVSKIHPNPQSEKISSFIGGSPSTSTIIGQTYINKSSTRKSWSPAGDVRISTKSTINTNTWRKGLFPSSFSNSDDQTKGRRFKVVDSPVRKPCAFFIPINNMEKGGDACIKENEITPLTCQAGVLDQAHKSVAAQSLYSLASGIYEKAVESGMQEAILINKNLPYPQSRSKEEKENLETLCATGGVNEERVPTDLSSRSRHDEKSTLNSAPEPSQDDRLVSSVSEHRDVESSSSGEYETSSEGQERNPYSLGTDGCGESNVPKDDNLNDSQSCTSRPQLQIPFRPTNDIEDLYENPPPFIPPPPQIPSSLTSSTQSTISAIRTAKVEPKSTSGKKELRALESKRDCLGYRLPKEENANAQSLSAERQTTRSHENLLDIDRVETGGQPCVLRGHSATLPSNAVAPKTARRLSALRQFFGIFRKDKKRTNASAPDALLDCPTNHKPLGGCTSVSEDCHQFTDETSPYISNRPSVSESQGSQRSHTSQTSTTKSVLSRIFRRREK